MMVMSLKPEESLVEACFPVPELPTRLPTQSDPSGACPGHHHYDYYHDDQIDFDYYYDNYNDNRQDDYGGHSFHFV